MRIIELGCAGHHCMSSRCRWKRHTQVGNSYRVSTVGDMYFDDRSRKRETVNASSFFETKVFVTRPNQEPENENCGCHDVADWIEIDGQNYDTAGEAQAGHEAMVAKYANLSTEAV